MKGSTADVDCVRGTLKLSFPNTLPLLPFLEAPAGAGSGESAAGSGECAAGSGESAAGSEESAVMSTGGAVVFVAGASGGSTGVFSGSLKEVLLEGSKTVCVGACNACRITATPHKDA